MKCLWPQQLDLRIPHFQSCSHLTWPTFKCTTLKIKTPHWMDFDIGNWNKSSWISIQISWDIKLMFYHWLRVIKNLSFFQIVRKWQFILANQFDFPSKLQFTVPKVLDQYFSSKLLFPSNWLHFLLTFTFSCNT